MAWIHPFCFRTQHLKPANVYDMGTAGIKKAANFYEKISGQWVRSQAVTIYFTRLLLATSKTFKKYHKLLTYYIL